VNWQTTAQLGLAISLRCLHDADHLGTKPASGNDALRLLPNNCSQETLE